MNPSGPIEDRDWPSELAARVITPTGAPRVHGCDLQSDLAVHYQFGELLLFTLTGTEPSDLEGHAFEVALAFASPVPVNEGPTHVGVLARLCGARTSAMIAAVTTTLAEQARALLDEHERFLPGLAVGEAPAELIGTDADVEAVSRLTAALGTFAQRVPALALGLRLETSILAVFLACGLRDRAHIEVALCIARLGLVAAESLAARPGDFRSYPMDVPNFRYEES